MVMEIFPRFQESRRYKGIMGSRKEASRFLLSGFSRHVNLGGVVFFRSDINRGMVHIKTYHGLNLDSIQNKFSPLT